MAEMGEWHFDDLLLLAVLQCILYSTTNAISVCVANTSLSVSPSGSVSGKQRSLLSTNTLPIEGPPCS